MSRFEENNNTRYQRTIILNITNYCLGFVEEQLLTSSQPNLEYEKCRKIISPSITRLVYSMKDNVAVSRFIHRFCLEPQLPTKINLHRVADNENRKQLLL